MFKNYSAIQKFAKNFLPHKIEAMNLPPPPPGCTPLKVEKANKANSSKPKKMKCKLSAKHYFKNKEHTAESTFK